MCSSQNQNYEAGIVELQNIFKQELSFKQSTFQFNKELKLERLKNFGRVHGFINDYGRTLAWNFIFENLGSNMTRGDPFEKVKSIKYKRNSVMF